MGGQQKDSTTTFLDGILTRTGSISSLFPLFFMFPLFLFVLLKGSPQSFSDNFPVIQATFQSTSQLSSQPVNHPENQGIEQVGWCLVYFTGQRYSLKISWNSPLFIFSSFSVCFAESVSPILLRRFPSQIVNWPVNQSTCQSTSQLTSQPVNLPVKQSNSLF